MTAASRGLVQPLALQWDHSLPKRRPHKCPTDLVSMYIRKASLVFGLHDATM